MTFLTKACEKNIITFGYGYLALDFKSTFPGSQADFLLQPSSRMIPQLHGCREVLKMLNMQRAAALPMKKSITEPPFYTLIGSHKQMCYSGQVLEGNTFNKIWSCSFELQF